MTTFYRILVITLGLVATSALANTYNYSYEFLDKDTGNVAFLVSGTLAGDPSADGKYVENVRDVTLVLNYTPVTGSIFTYTMITVSPPNGNPYGMWIPGAQVAFEGIDNNFLFMDTDYFVTQDPYHHYFMLKDPPWDSIAAAYQDPTKWENKPMVNERWSLTPASVPEGGLTIGLLGLALGGLGYLRRRV